MTCDPCCDRLRVRQGGKSMSRTKECEDAKRVWRQAAKSYDDACLARDASRSAYLSALECFLRAHEKCKDVKA